MDRNFKGVWIPKDVWFSKELTIREKIFYIEVDSLDVDGKGCWASNKHFSEFSGLSKNRCTEIIRNIEKKGFFRVEITRSGKQIVERRIFVVKKLGLKGSEMTGREPELPPGLETETGGLEPELPQSGTRRTMVENPKESNTKSSNTKSSNTKDEKTSCPGQKNVPDQPVEKIKKKRKYWGTDEDRKMAVAIYQAIYQVNPTIKKPNIDKWTNQIRLMREQDGRTHGEIEAAYRWAVRDNFWSEVMLSVSALRRNYHKFASKVGIVQSKTFGSAFDNRPNAGKKCKDCALYEIYGHIKTICSDPERHACDDLFRPKEEATAPVEVSS